MGKKEENLLPCASSHRVTGTELPSEEACLGRKQRRDSWPSLSLDSELGSASSGYDKVGALMNSRRLCGLHQKKPVGSPV